MNTSQPYHRVGAARSGAILLASSWISLIVLVVVYLALRPLSESGELLQQELQTQYEGLARMTALRGCVCPDTPLAEINEPNVFPGPSDADPDSPVQKPLTFAESCCGPMTLKEMHNVYELGEPNVPTWKEYEKERNSFPGIVDWDPDSPNREASDFSTKELFDGHGGILGLEDTDGWTKTPGSVGPKVQGEYTDGTEHKDYNVFANGYKFPHY